MSPKKDQGSLRRERDRAARRNSDLAVPTSFDVARKAGVSQSTVARVFARPNMVSPETRALVMNAAEALGYVPSAIAGGMRRQKSGLIAIVVPAGGEYWQNVVTEFARQVGDGGRQLLVTSFRDASGVESAIRSVSRYRLDGLVLASSVISAGQIVRLADTAAPVVAFNQPAAEGLIASVMVNNQAGAAAIAEHLLEKGVRNPVFVGGVSSASTDQLRYRGAVEVFGANSVSCAYVEAGGFNYEAGFKVGVDAAEWPRKHDAIMVAADELAFGVLDGLRASQRRVPDDVMVTGFDGLPQTAWEGYSLTTLVQPVEQLVSASLSCLVMRDSSASLIVDGVLRTGRSTNKETTNG